MICTLIAIATMSLTTATPKWTMTFHDEFDGAKGDPPSIEYWGRDLGGGGFGNNELESYTDGPKNAFLDGEGHLVIEARKESTTGSDGIHRDYSSARLKTKGKFSQKYGKFEARIKLPRGQGIWPAFWMLGDNINKAGWPGCGEIDILESIGPIAKAAHGTLHGPGYSGSNGKTAQYDSPVSLADGFHVYSVEWKPEGIEWFVDGKSYHRVGPKDVAPNGWPFDQPFFIIMNLAVGGGWPGNPDSTTQFPQRMIVDYVRVYRES